MDQLQLPALLSSTFLCPVCLKKSSGQTALWSGWEILAGLWQGTVIRNISYCKAMEGCAETTHNFELSTLFGMLGEQRNLIHGCSRLLDSWLCHR